MENAAPRFHWARWPVFVVIALIGLAVRLPHLGLRPMHTDEAVNGYIVGQLLSGETYKYDPQDRHGPALAALALPLARIQGAHSFSELTESELRLTSVAAGMITIVLFGAGAEMFGFVPSLLAAVLFALAPLPVYYDRYFIHESLFCAATLGLILSGWRACETRSIGLAAVAGGCAGLMFACKETAFLHFFALASAAFVFRLRKSRGGRAARPIFPGLVLTALGTFVALVVSFFTWFGTNRNALPALLRAVPDVLARAGGQGHEKPLWYYGRLLTGGWSGGLLFGLAFAGFIISARRRDSSPFSFLSYYAFIIAAIYSVIPYKTPWLALNLWLPMALLAGKAVECLWRCGARKMTWRVEVSAFCFLAGLAAVLIAHDTRRRVFLYPADEINPYAYAHTTDDIAGLPSEIQDLCRRNAVAKPRIAVIASDPWPLPWYLRHFEQVGFWQPGQRVGEADFYVTSTEAADQYADRLRNFRPEFFGVRPGVLILLWSPESK